MDEIFSEPLMPYSVNSVSELSALCGENSIEKCGNKLCAPTLDRRADVIDRREILTSRSKIFRILRNFTG